MKRLVILASLLVSASSYAFTCPGNGNFLETGYSIEKVLALCGQPVTKNEFQKSINSSEEWTYYKKDNRSNANIKATLTINNGQVVNIYILNTGTNNNQLCNVKNQFSQIISVPCNSTEQNLQTSNFCSRLIQVGSSANYIQSVCGTPATQKTLVNNTVNIAEYTYNGTGPNTLIFKDGLLLDWKY
jgi:hypothetical protein